MFFETNLVTALKDRSNSAGQQIAFSFLSPRSKGPETLTYRALDTKAQAIAQTLLARAKALGQPLRQTPVLIALPAGLEFLQCYFGCLYSGAIAVPLKYPQLNRPMEHTQNVAADCGAQLVISTLEMQDWLRAALPSKTILAVEDFPEAAEGIWLDPGLGAADIAHLQYTSGSTSAPKGVAISHKNIAHNATDVCNSFHISADSRLLCWLPHYHDLGLVFGCIVPVYSGCLSLLMPPAHFALRPVRWLQAMQNHGVTHSAAPNFAFDACLAIPPAATAGLDLSAVEALLNGAEPVRAETVQAFATRFAQNGLGADVQCPSYGMAENTLVLSVNGPGCALHQGSFDSDALQQRRLVPATDVTARHRGLVACNGSPLGSKIRIVNPETLDLCAPGEIGEIWAQGPSVAAGYWHRDALSQQKFHAQIPHQSGDWLRTGDLGGFCGEDLFVIGRLDDVMVLRGINYSPEDIELTVEACDPALEQGGSIVFSSEIGTAMRLVVVHEVTRSALRILRRKGVEAEALQQHLVNTIRTRLAEQHDLELGALVLLPPKGLPKTHTGKKKRHACRSEFAAGTFTGVATWISPRHAPAQSQSQSHNGARSQAQPQTQSETQSKTQAPDITPQHATIATRPAATAATSQPRVTMPVDMPNNGPDSQHEAQPEKQPEKTANLIGWLREYGENRLNSRLMDERRTIPPHVVMDFGNKGLLGMVAPKRYGGLGLRNCEILDVVAQLAAIDTTLASFTVVNNALGLRPILRHAQPELVDRLMPNLARGRELASFAMTEAGAGSNIRNLAAIGRPDGRGGWHLHGTKLWSGTAAWAGVINTFVRLENPTGGGQAVSGFVLEAGAAGLRQGPEALTLGLRAMVQNQVVLDGVKVTADQRLGEIGQGMTAATDAMEYGRFAIAAMSLGVIKRCLQLMLRHGDRRTIATGRLLDNPATNLRISELAAASSAIEALIRTVAAQLDAELPPPPELYCACKSLAPEYAWKAADGLIQQMAGRGYVENNIAPQILRDARVLRIFEGPTEPMNAHIGARLVQFPEELQHYVGTRLGQPGLATELDEMAQQIWHHHLDQPAIWGGLAAAKAQAHLTIGEAAAHGLMLACLTHQITTAPGFLPAAVAKRAQDWSRLQFTHSRAKALTPSAALTARLDREAMEILRDSCATAIGDVEQQMAAVDTDLDGLIRRDRPNHSKHHATGATNAASPEPASGEAPAPSEIMVNAATQTVADWIKNWMAAEFQIDAAEIEDDARFAVFGMDSVAAMLLTGALETWVGADLPASVVWEHRSIAALANHVAGLPGVEIPRAETLSQPSTAGAPGPSDLQQSDPQLSHTLASDPMSLLAQADALSEAELEALIQDFAETVQEAT